MNRLDRYYIPPGVPARPPAPPLPRKGILHMPPPHPPPSRQPRHPHQIGPPSFQPQSQFRAGGPQSLPMQPDVTAHPPGSRRPLPPRLLDYEAAVGMQPMLPPRPLDSQNLASAMSLPDPSSPRMALQRILDLYEKGDHREAAAFMRRLSFPAFRQILPQLPADIFVESMPHSLPILEALYAKLFLAGDSKLLGKAQSLRPEAVVWQLVKFFASQDDGLLQVSSSTGQVKWEFCGPFISSCKRLLKVLLSAEPRLRRLLAERKRALMKAIEGLGQHGMVGTSDEQMMNLHAALRLEFEKAQKTYTNGVTKLEALSLVNPNSKGDKAGKGTTVSGKVAPIAQSHQRQLSLKAAEIQERLIKNKSLLNVVEPTLENTPLEVLLGILQQRIELDKECLFQFTQIKKTMKLDAGEKGAAGGGKAKPSPGGGHSVAPVLMRYQRGCQQVLDLIKELCEDSKDGSTADLFDDDDLFGGGGAGDLNGCGGDLSAGYHSDSESCVMTSGNSPFISKEARYNFLSRSVRLGSKHNIRASILASSLCLDSASMRGGSIKGPGSIISTSVVNGDRGHGGGAPSVPNGSNNGLVLNSSSGVSSGSTGSSSGEENNKPDSPTPSAATVVNKSAAVGSDKAEVVKPRPRHLKPRASKANSVASSHRSAAKYNSVDDNDSSSEPIYQGIVEMDIGAIRKEAEIESLRSDLSRARLELDETRRSLFVAEDAEKAARAQLASERHRTTTLERMVASAPVAPAGASASNPANTSMLNRRDHRCNRGSVELVRRYGELYSLIRLETLDSLDRLPELVNSEELKNKLLFSVVVLSFRSVTSSVQTKREQMRRILQLPPPPPPAAPPPASVEEVAPTLPASAAASEGEERAAARDVEEAISDYLRRATEGFDLTKSVEEVCTQIWATLYDYPCLKSCDGIVRYVKECVRVAWGLVNQSPVYAIEYEERHFRPDLHVRYHASNPDQEIIQTYLWPALLEGKDGPCVQKGVVVT